MRPAWNTSQVLSQDIKKGKNYPGRRKTASRETGAGAEQVTVGSTDQQGLRGRQSTHPPKGADSPGPREHSLVPVSRPAPERTIQPRWRSWRARYYKNKIRSGPRLSRGGCISEEPGDREGRGDPELLLSPSTHTQPSHRQPPETPQTLRKADRSGQSGPLGRRGGGDPDPDPNPTGASSSG